MTQIVIDDVGAEEPRFSVHYEMYHSLDMYDAGRPLYSGTVTRTTPRLANVVQTCWKLVAQELKFDIDDTVDVPRKGNDGGPRPPAPAPAPE